MLQPRSDQHQQGWRHKLQEPGIPADRRLQIRPLIIHHNPCHITHGGDFCFQEARKYNSAVQTAELHTKDDIPCCSPSKIIEKSLCILKQMCNFANEI